MLLLSEIKEAGHRFFYLKVCCRLITGPSSYLHALAFVSAAKALVKEQAQENQNEKQNFAIVPIAEKAVCHDYFPPLQYSLAFPELLLFHLIRSRPSGMMCCDPCHRTGVLTTNCQSQHPLPVSQNRSRNRMMKNNISLLSPKNPLLSPMFLTPLSYISLTVYSG
jgi:hypothetical protein